MTMRRMVTGMRNMVMIPEACRERFLPLDDPELAVLGACGLRNAGRSILAKGYYNGFKRPLDTMVIWSLSGSAHFEHEGGSLAIAAGTLLIRGPGQACHFWPVQTPWRLAWAYCERGLDGSRKMPQGVQLVSYGEGERVWNLLSDLIEECHRPPEEPTTAVYRRRLAEALLVWLERAGAACTRDPIDPERQRLDRLVTALRSEPGRAWQLADMAALLDCSSSSLQRQVRQHFGESPHRLLVHLRMELAARLVRQSDYPLAVIAQQVGYADAFIFSAAFKRYHGQAPSRWRETRPL